MKRHNGPLYQLLRKLWDFEPAAGDPEHEDCPEDAVPLCLNCLEPEVGHQWFCKECGWPTSFNGSQMPFIKVYCLGAYFRSGVDGSVPLTPFRITGLVCASAVQYGIFAPLYWYRLHQAEHGKFIQNRGQPKELRENPIRDEPEFSDYSLSDLMDEYQNVDPVDEPEWYQLIMDEFEKRKIDPLDL